MKITKVIVFSEDKKQPMMTILTGKDLNAGLRLELEELVHKGMSKRGDNLD